MSRPKNTAVDVNSSLTWNCKADGVPPIVYTWLHNGRVMKQSANSSYYVINEGTLRFPRLQVSQRGMYQCHASNSVKELITAAELDVMGTCALLSTNPGAWGRVSRALLREGHLPHRYLGICGMYHKIVDSNEWESSVDQ